MRQRELDVLDHVQHRDEVERLEDEADLAVADVREIVEVAGSDLLAVQLVRTGAGVESRQPMMLSSVVLPEPEGPMTTVNSPRSMSRSTPLSAGTSGLAQVVGLLQSADLYEVGHGRPSQ